MWIYYIIIIKMMLKSLAGLALLSLASCAPQGGYPIGRKEYYIDMPIDHFTNGGAGSATYKMRYFVDA